ncbi:MvdC/MvdD family ATP grasp protein [Williamsia sp. M5A3_1d]
MGEPKVLAITSQPDTHLNGVLRELAAGGLEMIRLNSDDLFTNCVVDLTPADGSGRISIIDSGQSFEIEDVVAVWYRKPETPSIAHLAVDEFAEKQFFEAEAYEAMLSIYSVLQDVPWINNPLTTRLAFRRFHQLRVAKTLGFRTVRSRFSNDEDAVLDFAEGIQGPVALKSLSSLSVSRVADSNIEIMNQYGILTRTIDQRELLALRASIGAMPTFVQEYIDKSADLRVVCVGREVFACRIDSQVDDLTRLDFRIGTKRLSHEIIDLPDQLIVKIQMFLERLNIEFGCFDFLEDGDREPYFLECNPNGQWLWIEQQTGAPISSAVAKHLTDLAGSR